MCVNGAKKLSSNEGFQALATPQHVAAAQYAQYEDASRVSMQELRSAVRAAIQTSQQPQRQLEALSSQRVTAQAELQRAAAHRGQLETSFSELLHSADVHAETRAQRFGAPLAQQRGAAAGAGDAALQHQRAAADAVVNELRAGMLQRVEACLSQRQAEAELCRKQEVELGG